MSDTAFLTIVTRDYYGWAKTWASSIREHHQDADIIIAFADTPTTAHEACLDEYRTLRITDHSEELGIGNYHRMSFQYTPFELTCALKPFVVRQLHKQYERVIYLDADTFVYRPLNDIMDVLASQQIVVTPHLLEPQTIEKESRIRAAGTLNGGFLATRRGSISQQFLGWWSDRCRQECYIDPFAGRFVDQSWLELASSFFESFHLIREPTLNVAYWNLPSRPLTEKNGAFFVKDLPLGFFHFSGFDPQKPNFISRFDNQVLSSDLLKLTTDYGDRLRANDQRELHDIPCEFKAYRDGTEIDPIHREAIRSQLPEFADIANPFDTQSHPELPDQLNAAREKLILSRKHWQLEELQKLADRQTEWIQKRVNRRIDKRVMNTIRNLCVYVSDTVFSRKKNPDDSAEATENKAA